MPSSTTNASKTRSVNFNFKSDTFTIDGITPSWTDKNFPNPYFNIHEAYLGGGAPPDTQAGVSGLCDGKTCYQLKFQCDEVRVGKRKIGAAVNNPDETSVLEVTAVHPVDGPWIITPVPVWTSEDVPRLWSLPDW